MIKEIKQRKEDIPVDPPSVKELEKRAKLDKNLLRYLTVKVKKFDLDTNYFGPSNDNKKEL